MHGQRNQPLLVAMLAVGLAAALPALACDMAELHAIALEACSAAIGETSAVLDGLEPHATAAERALIARHLGAARTACADGNAGFAAVEAARLARLAGRIEARLGNAPPIWAQQDAGLQR